MGQNADFAVSLLYKYRIDVLHLEILTMTRFKSISLDEARNKYRDYRYALVDSLTDRPYCLCKTLEDAKAVLENEKINFLPLRIVKLED